MTARLSHCALYCALLALTALFWLRLDAWLAVHG